ncbi:anaerobic ribonucleoside-triphosphate reductase [Candidatus Hydrogenedentota bacterium]
MGAERIAEEGMATQDEVKERRTNKLRWKPSSQHIADQPAGRITHVRKRDGGVVVFDKNKICEAIFKAACSVGGEDRDLSENIADVVSIYLRKHFIDGIPSVENIQDSVEKVLVELGHAKTALAYARYRDKRSRIRTLRDGNAAAFVEELEQAAPQTTETTETTDLSLFVRTSSEDIIKWDTDRIVEALIRETGLNEDVAMVIAREVERQIVTSKTKIITAPLVRELVDAKLIEYGLEEYRKRHTRLGVPLYDAEQVIAIPNKENANIPHNPEATNLMLAEKIKKEFALLKVFTQDVADAHICGNIHLHDLGFIDRPYCSGQSIEYVKKFGLDLPNALSIAGPAKHPETLLAHMVKFSAALQGHFAGAIGWDAINIFFAPFLEDLDDAQMHQMAQMLIFEYSQQAVARGGQAIFSDVNLYWEIPKHFEDVEAIGPGGKKTGRKYSDYLETAQRFVWALFDVYKEGDGCGRPFFFPKPLVHITEKFFQTPRHEEFLNHISDVAADKGNTYFVFDRGQTAKISECCRLSFKLEQSDLEDAKEPWRMRYSALQNVTLNLPRAAYKANGSEAKLFREIEDLMEVVAKAHRQKKEFIEKLLALKGHGPLSLLTMERDGQPYLRMHRVTYLVGILGLNELVQAHLGEALHESEEAFQFGMKVVAHLNLTCRRLSARDGMRFVLEQTPAESTGYRMAKLDLAQFGDKARNVVKGDLESNEVYYTNSTQLDVQEVMNPIERVEKEGQFHDMIEAGALTHIWLADSHPSPESIANFVKKTFTNTRNAQVAFSPEFTACNVCGKVTRGLRKECVYCGTENVDGITRVTGYFSRTSGWNPGKTGELKDRARWKENSAETIKIAAAVEHDKKNVDIFGVGLSDLHPKGCAKCDQAKKVIGEKMNVRYRFWDIDSPEGLAELSRRKLNELAEKSIPVISIGRKSYNVLGDAVKTIKKLNGSLTIND